MCGICGMVRASGGRPFPPDTLPAMLRTLVHRGPDDEGKYEESTVALGARRLSIIDLQTGHQPLGNEDGTVWVAHNGEIYNFPTLRQELEACGHRFSSRTDTETIAHAYEEWGDSFIARLRGMFAFSLWDKRRNRLLLVRDRIGIKPLYYTQLPDGTLVFGSEVKALLAFPGVRRELNYRALDLFLTLEYIPAPHSIFKGIFKLPAGCFLEYREGETRLVRYWDIEPVNPAREGEGKKGTSISLDQAQDALFALLKESVSLRLLSDVPLGAFLSGGIDSSCIVGLMRELGASPLRTFSIGFEDATYNERDSARTAARAFRTEHEEFILQPQVLDLTEKLVRHLDEPLGDFSIFPTYLVSQMARQRVTVALSGDGGDEIFGGYEHYQAQKLARPAPVRHLCRAASLLLHSLPPSQKKKGFWNKLRRFVQGARLPAESRHMRWMTFLSPEEKKSLYTPGFKQCLGSFDFLEEEPFAGIFQRLPAFDPINAELYLDLKTYLPDNILVKVDRMSMAVSLEARVPLLDHKVVEYAFGLPGNWKLRGLKTKWIFKKTMERLLPRENIYRPKEGFSIPIKNWLRKELRDFLQDTLSEKSIREGGLFVWKEVERMKEAHLRGRENYSHQLWALLVLEVWKQNYGSSRL